MKGTIDQQNIPDSRGTSVVPIRATQSPPTNYFIACGFAPGLSLPVSASVGRINAIELVFLFSLNELIFLYKVGLYLINYNVGTLFIISSNFLLSSGNLPYCSRMPGTWDKTIFE